MNSNNQERWHLMDVIKLLLHAIFPRNETLKTISVDSAIEFVGKYIENKAPKAKPAVIKPKPGSNNGQNTQSSEAPKALKFHDNLHKLLYDTKLQADTSGVLYQVILLLSTEGNIDKISNIARMLSAAYNERYTAPHPITTSLSHKLIRCALKSSKFLSFVNAIEANEAQDAINILTKSTQSYDKLFWLEEDHEFSLPPIFIKVWSILEDSGNRCNVTTRPQSHAILILKEQKKQIDRVAETLKKSHKDLYSNIRELIPINLHNINNILSLRDFLLCNSHKIQQYFEATAACTVINEETAATQKVLGLIVEYHKGLSGFIGFKITEIFLLIFTDYKTQVPAKTQISTLCKDVLDIHNQKLTGIITKALFRINGLATTVSKSCTNIQPLNAHLLQAISYIESLSINSVLKSLELMHSEHEKERLAKITTVTTHPQTQKAAQKPPQITIILRQHSNLKKCIFTLTLSTLTISIVTIAYLKQNLSLLYTGAFVAIAGIAILTKQELTNYLKEPIAAAPSTNLDKITEPTTAKKTSTKE